MLDARRMLPCGMRIIAIVSLLLSLACAQATVPAAPPAAPSSPAAAASRADCRPATALVNATLWMQNSAEYRANALQAYAAARRALDAALADPSWVGATEDSPAEASQPPAIVLDLDETALDNSAFEARMIRQAGPFDQASWDAWVEEAAATATPGAAEFLSYARGRGVTPFYVTNRAAKEEPATRRNLEKLGFPLDRETDTLLVLGERPEWTGDKSTRRAWVAASHRLLLLLGDDLNDFASARDLTPAARKEIVERNAGWWGTRWIVLPNPAYGSFERAVTGGSGTPCEQLQKKIDALRDR